MRLRLPGEIQIDPKQARTFPAIDVVQALVFDRLSLQTRTILREPLAR